jgi:hypothetical protein
VAELAQGRGVVSGRDSSVGVHLLPECLVMVCHYPRRETCQGALLENL